VKHCADEAGHDLRGRIAQCVAVDLAVEDEGEAVAGFDANAAFDAVYFIEDQAAVAIAPLVIFVGTWRSAVADAADADAAVTPGGGGAFGCEGEDAGDDGHDDRGGGGDPVFGVLQAEDDGGDAEEDQEQADQSPGAGSGEEGQEDESAGE
jgi:hypothetical protein